MKKSEKNTKNISKKKLTKSQNISTSLKISQKISKYLKCSLNFSNVVFQTWFCETGFCIAYFSGPYRKSQKISNHLKKSQNISNLLEKTKNKKKTRENQIKLTQPYNNFAEAGGRIAAQLSAVIIFPCVVKCWASMMKGFKTHLLVTWCIAMYCLITTGRSQSKKNQIKSNKFRYNQINDWIWGKLFLIEEICCNMMLVAQNLVVGIP